MRGDHDVGIAEQRMVGDRLLAEDVQCRRGDLAGVQGVLECGVDDQRAAGDVEYPHAVLHLREGGGVEPVLGVRGAGQVHGDEVSRGIHLLGRQGALGAEFAEALLADEGVEGEHPHAEAVGAGRDQLADPAEAEDAERLGMQLDTGEPGAVPGTGDEGGMRLRHVAGQRQQQRHGVLGRCDHIRLRRVGDHDAQTGRGLDVDVVHADARARNDPQPGRPGQQARVKLGRRTDQDALELADPAHQLGIVPVEAAHDLDPGRTQQRLPGTADLLRDENSQRRHRGGHSHRTAPFSGPERVRGTATVEPIQSDQQAQRQHFDRPPPRVKASRTDSDNRVAFEQLMNYTSLNIAGPSQRSAPGATDRPIPPPRGATSAAMRRTAPTHR